MAGASEKDKRAYDGSRRRAAAARTREAVLHAAQAEFEERGWSGTTVAAVARRAGVSPKTVEAAFGTKVELLRETVSVALRGDMSDVPMVERPAARAVEEAADLAAALDAFVEHAAPITERSARMALVVEAAALADERVAPLWDRMRANRRFGARWGATCLAAKPGARAGLAAADAEVTVLLAIDWATHRTLRIECGMSSDEVRAWMRASLERSFSDTAGEARASGDLS